MSRSTLRGTTGKFESWEDLGLIIAKLQKAVYRARRVKAWADCEPWGRTWENHYREYVEPTEERIDQWLEELNTLVEEVNNDLDGVRLTN
jgi:hypothetical protein